VEDPSRADRWLCPECDRTVAERVCPEHGTLCLLEDAPRSDPSTVRPGMILAGRYRIERPLGRGGFAVVYAARHVATGQGVAIKVLSGGSEDDATALRRFFREARATASLRHPSTVRVFDFGQEESGLTFLAMELLTGRTLRGENAERRQRKQSFTEQEAITVGLAVTQCLAEAHAAGLVHRDLKPSNIFLHRVPGNEPVIKVLDFGVAKAAGPALTRANIAIGTASYMSPEQARDLDVDGRSDLYSLGLILYWMIAGETPFRKSTPLEMMLAHVNERPPDLREHARVPVSDRFAKLVERALAKAPRNRFKNAQEMRAALLECSTVTVNETSIGATTHEERVVRRATRYYAGAAIAASLAVIALTATNALDEPPVQIPVPPVTAAVEPDQAEEPSEEESLEETPEPFESEATSPDEPSEPELKSPPLERRTRTKTPKRRVAIAVPEILKRRL
jgi:eukaryotic-like serine/threonine-protein kinase